MKKLMGFVLVALLMMSCGGTQVSLKTAPNGTVQLDATTPEVEVTPPPPQTASVQRGPQPYAQDDSCQSFHDNGLVGQPYAVGFHYCLYAEGPNVLTGCTHDAETQRSLCFDAEQNPKVGVQWHEIPGFADGELYVPQHDGPLATVHGEVTPIPGGRVMQYVITYIDGTHSTCTVGGPTVQYCRVDW